LSERFTRARKISGCMGSNFTLISPIATERILKGSVDVSHFLHKDTILAKVKEKAGGGDD
jgi:hypothetical protein